MAAFNDLNQLKILFLGDEGVGKTTLLKKYCEYCVREGYTDEIYEGVYLAFTQFQFDLLSCKASFSIRLLDSPARTTAASLRDQYPAKVEIVVFCFAIDNPTSLANISRIWLPEIRRQYSDSVSSYLLGLKSDLRGNPERILELRRANKELVKGASATDFHSRHGFVGNYMECSVAEDPEHSNDTMTELIKDLFLLA